MAGEAGSGFPCKERNCEISVHAERTGPPLTKAKASNAPPAIAINARGFPPPGLLDPGERCSGAAPIEP